MRQGLSPENKLKDEENHCRKLLIFLEMRRTCEKKWQWYKEGRIYRVETTIGFDGSKKKKRLRQAKGRGVGVQYGYTICPRSGCQLWNFKYEESKNFEGTSNMIGYSPRRVT